MLGNFKWLKNVNSFNCFIYLNEYEWRMFIFVSMDFVSLTTTAAINEFFVACFVSRSKRLNFFDSIRLWNYVTKWKWKWMTIYIYIFLSGYDPNGYTVYYFLLWWWWWWWFIPLSSLDIIIIIIMMMMIVFFSFFSIHLSFLSFFFFFSINNLWFIEIHFNNQNCFYKTIMFHVFRFIWFFFSFFLFL